VPVSVRLVKYVEIKMIPVGERLTVFFNDKSVGKNGSDILMRVKESDLLFQLVRLPHIIGMMNRDISAGSDFGNGFVYPPYAPFAGIVAKRLDSGIGVLLNQMP